MRIFCCVLLSVCLSTVAIPARAQWSKAWDRTVGGESYEELNGLVALPDGSALLGGSSKSNIAFGRPNDYSWNFLLVKLDPNGNILWQRMYGGDQDERLWALIPTSDGGFLAGGHSFSGVSGEKSVPSRGYIDIWVIKVDADGALQWDAAFGGDARDDLFSLLEMPGGGFLLGGFSASGANGDRTEPSRGDEDFWMLRIDASGKKLWDKAFGGDKADLLNDMIWADDGTVYLSGGTLSGINTGDLGSAPEGGVVDFLLANFDPQTRQINWVRRYGGTGEEFPYACIKRKNGNLLIGGRSNSVPSPNAKNAPFYGGPGDFWIVETNPSGNQLRDWSFGGSGLDDLYFISESDCGQIVAGGVTDSGPDGNKTAPALGLYDYWVIGLDADGAVEWQQSLGGADHDAPTQIARFDDGSLVIAGHSQSNTGFEKSENSKGLNDFWVFRTRCDVNPQINISGDMTPCTGNSVELSVYACAGCTYLWNTGETAHKITAPPGTNAGFSVRVCSGPGCTGSDSAYIELNLPPVVDIGPEDTLILNGNTLSLGTFRPGLTWQWSTGSKNHSVQVSEEGFYSVTVTNESGCTAEDQIFVGIVYAGKIYVPNIFSPDLDGENDYFNIAADRSVLKVKTLQVADRWGDLCYRRDDFVPTPDFFSGWDGYVRGKPASEGVYTWFAVLEMAGGTERLMTGSVTIVR